MRAFTLGCGMELAPDPDRRLSLASEKDALGMPRLKLEMRKRPMKVLVIDSILERPTDN